jgi:ABC-type glycerol-3-phosphate transport system permease component
VSGKTVRKPVDTFKFILRKVLLVILAAMVVFPLVYMLSSSLFRPTDFNRLHLFPDTPNFANYAKALSHRYFGHYMVNSVGTALFAAVVRSVVVILAAFAFTHLRFKGKNFFLGALVLTLFVPQEAILYQNYRTVAALGLIDTWTGIVSTSLFSAAQMLLLMGAFSGIGKEPYDAARIDGATDLRYIANVLIPMTGPVVLTMGIQTMITTFNSYLWPLLVTNRPQSRTIQVGITMLGFVEASDIGAQMAALTIVTVPFLVVLALAKKRIETALIRS